MSPPSVPVPQPRTGCRVVLGAAICALGLGLGLVPLLALTVSCSVEAVEASDTVEAADTADTALDAAAGVDAADAALDAAAANDPSPLSVKNLRCEYLRSPLGLDVGRPRLGWTLEAPSGRGRQTAYRILVASSVTLLRKDEGDLWDSGKVLSEEMAQIEYGGKPLPSLATCHWKVRVWDGDGRTSGYSEPSLWEMGYLDPAEWRGRWIARTDESAYAPAPHLRREFSVSGKVRRARLHVCGLGYHEVRLNGRKVGDHHLDPGYTRYDKRVLAVTHDVTDHLEEGANALGAILGTGWYNVHTLAVWYFEKAPWRASPRLLLDLRIDYEDGRRETIATDGSWKTAAGPIVFDSIYGGETYDARLEIPGWDRPGFDDSSWAPARLVEAPAGRIVAQKMPPIRIVRSLKPVKVTEPKPGTFVFDMGQNVAGHARLEISGAAGTRVVLRYGERLAEDGTLDPSIIAQHMVKTDPPQRFQTDEYILKGEGREGWEPRFVYHGFQYVEVTGAPGKLAAEDLRGRVVHSDVAPVGRFVCSNDILNRIWESARRAYLSNLHGIPTDCPHREKNGWTGDAHLAAEQGLFGFDAAAVYAKWIDDLDDEQRKADEGKRHRGELPGIVPTSGWGYDWGNGPAWDSAFLLIPWYLYEYCGDRRILERHYDGFKLYVDYLTRRSKDGIVSIGLGDWCPFKTETPVEVTSTGYYYRDARILAEAAAILGKKEDAATYSALADSIRSAFNARFYVPETGLYSNGSQTALGCALYQGLAPEDARPRVLEGLVASVERSGGHPDFGILGSKYVLSALTDGGRADVAYAMASKRTYPSWGNWLDRGATTLWEDWAGTNSRNHIMFGDIAAWFFRTLAGIRPDPGAPGFRRVIVKPHPVGDLAWVLGEYDSIRGRIVSEWRKEGGAFRLRVVIPVGATGLVWLPVPEGASVGLEPPADVVLSRARAGDRTVYEVSAGEHRFEVR